jgi:hypothetical protein
VLLNYSTMYNICTDRLYSIGSRIKYRVDLRHLSVYICISLRACGILFYPLKKVIDVASLEYIK